MYRIHSCYPLCNIFKMLIALKECFPVPVYAFCNLHPESCTPSLKPLLINKTLFQICHVNGSLRGTCHISKAEHSQKRGDASFLFFQYQSSEYQEKRLASTVGMVHLLPTAGKRGPKIFTPLQEKASFFKKL